MTNLKPCPFCGQNFLVKILGNTDEVKRIYCKTCDFDVSNSRWNERKIPEKSIEVFKEMVEALKSVKEIIQDSDGVAGYHLNGQIADWDELNLEFEIEKALARAKEVGIFENNSKEKK